MPNLLFSSTAPSARPADMEHKLVTLLQDCGLETHLHDRALFGVSRRLWQDGYVRGRSKPERLADLIGHKLQLTGPAADRPTVRAKVLAKSENQHFSMVEALDFITWAERVNQCTALGATLHPSAISAENRGRILAHFFELSFDLPPAEAEAALKDIRTRELDDIKNMAALTQEVACAGLGHYGAFRTYGLLSSMSHSARTALLAKAAGAGIKLKLVVVPLGAASGAVGILSGVAAASSAVYATWYGIATAYSTLQLGRVLWRDQFELERPSVRDAAVLHFVAALNAQEHTADLVDAAEEQLVLQDG